MKYVELIKDNKQNIVSVAILDYGKFVETKDGGLLQIVNDKPVILLKPGFWAIIDGSDKPSKKSKAPTKKNSNKLWMRPYYLSPALRVLVKKEKAPRVDIIKAVWNYIKKHGLQDTKDKRMLNVGDDAITKAIFNKQQISMFEMSNAISKIISLKPYKE